MKTYGLVRLAAEPKLREVKAEGKTEVSKVVNFRVCADKAFRKPGSAEFGHKLTFIDAVAWGKLAERIATYKTGQKLMVEGELQERSYISKKHGDTKITVHEILVENVANLGASKKSATAAPVAVK